MNDRNEENGIGSPEETTSVPRALEKKEGRLWNRNFLLLWQGQVISSIGDVVYEIALGFWILAVTGSTALMGTLMAASVLPRVLVSPFAGVVVDRSDRKWLIVLTDLVRAIAVVFVAVAAFQGWVQIWMVFAAGIIIGLCGAFFSPAISSALPDLVPHAKLMQANSIYSMVYSASGILGNSFGGFLYSWLGGPLLFLINGLSFLYSTISVLFVRVPKITRQGPSQHFFADMKDGYRFVWRWRNLRWLIIFAACANFFATVAIVAIIPFFQQTPGLGPAYYGVIMALLAGGQLAGMLGTYAIPIKAGFRYRLFVFSALLCFLFFALFPVFLNVPFMATVAFLGGLFNAVVNVLLQTVMQLNVPADMRGKVFSLLGALSQGLVPIAMALGGVLAGFVPLRLLIFIAFLLPVFTLLPLFAQRDFKNFFTTEPAQEPQPETR